MRRIKRPPIEVFNLSFLDIISCAFGAVIMLVLLAKNGEQDTEQGSADLSVLIENVLAAQQSVESLKGALSDKQQELAAAQAQSASVTEQQKNLETSIPRAQQTLAQLQDKAKSLREEIRQANARLNVENSAQEPDEEVGGIPTDADYVVFVIDNSGSMSSGSSWMKVTQVVKDIIKSHPQMKGFQIMAADGTHMYSSQRGKWLSDSQSMRDKAISRLAGFRGGASAPEVGINDALDLYGSTQGKVSLYVFGDDYRPADLDSVVSQITSKNADQSGRAKVRIHGIGFNRPRNGNAQQFAAFMQAVAKRNRGAFVGLYF
ncbi:VWA domain-containing protein [Salinimonas sp. HHU 13199]|uniref:VWA domain-containing protein n=1 Tax=Salinimonas profundi TaxID=2729140 RepID=A0ABR8LL58_9ALTE|nr:VWA domain-containing protein [Salinimonas profundi]MBD3586937.1 VWA domain-containing protein [Salinimonas profundi]